MADRITSVYRLNRIEHLRRATPKEIAEKIKQLEKESNDYQLEKRKYLSQFPDNNKDLNFAEELGKLVGEEIKKPSAPTNSEDEEGFILDISTQK